MFSRRTVSVLLLVISCAIAVFALSSCSQQGSPVPALHSQDNIPKSNVSPDTTSPGESLFTAEDISDKPLESEPYELTLGFIGDICLADNYIPMQRLAELGTDDLSQGIDPAYIRQMNLEDIMWANNEFVYCDRGQALPGKAWTFCSKTSNVGYLHTLGVDIVGLANNHTFDFGQISFEDTLTTLQYANIPYVGAGWDERCAYAPVYIEREGVKVAYVAASRAEYTLYTLEATPDKPGIAWCYDNEKFLASIREAADNADFVVALPHWGTEHSTDLEAAQTDGAKAYIDAGADVVIGAHPHILQGAEYYKGKPILYSLGNFWFDDYDIDTVLAEIRISGRRGAGEKGLGDDPKIEMKLYPGVQSGVYTRCSQKQEEKDRIFRHLEEISPQPIQITQDGVLKSEG